MKETIKTSRTAGYMEKIFRALNSRYFDSQLEEPVITIQSTPRAYGHVTVAKAWARADGERRHELNIGAGTLARPIEEVAATLLHEMVHYFNYKNGVQDCSRGNTYHNKKFKAAAEAHGLTVTHSDKYGWSHTAPGEALLDFILENGLTDILINRNEYGGFQVTGTGTHSGTGTTPPRRPSSTRKYICPCCGNSVRATKTVNIACLDCDVQMVVAG